MHEMLTELGIGMEQTPRCHPELAGRGIEYCWGKAKLDFRRTNDFNPQKEAIERRVVQSLQVPLALARKFARKAGEYKRAYMALIEGKGLGVALEFADIESIRKKVKTHRSALSLDLAFILSA
jgi:hypothetical protein